MRSYCEESNRLDDVQIDEDELERVVDDEVKKVLVNMLPMRVLLAKRALLFVFKYPKKISVPFAIQYAVDLYEDFLKHRAQHLKLLDTLRK